MQRIFVASLLLKYSGGRLSLILIISRIHKKKEENSSTPIYVILRMMILKHDKTSKHFMMNLVRSNRGNVLTPTFQH